MKTLATLLVLALSLLASGCSTTSPIYLNDPAKSKEGRDVANLYKDRSILYETQEVEGLAVSYNLMFFPAAGGNFSGYRLTMIFKNLGGETINIRPKVMLRDAAGLQIEPYEYAELMAEASILAGTAQPAYMPSPPPQSFASGFAQGLAQARAAQAASDREEGKAMMRWANAFWMKETYSLPDGSAAAGALLFPSSSIGLTPLRLTIDVGGRRFNFATVTAGAKQ